MADVDRVVREVFEEVIGYDWEDVKPTDDLRTDLGMDSLDMEKLATELEDRLNIQIEPGYFTGIRTVYQLTESLNKLTERVQ